MLAVFGITSDGLNLAINLAILFLVILWLALVYWTWSDARRRIGDPLLVGCATLAAIVFPFLGCIVYAIVRPPEFLDDVYEREASIDASEALVRVLGEVLESQRQLQATHRSARAAGRRSAPPAAAGAADGRAALRVRLTR